MLYFDGKPIEAKYFPNKELYLETDFLQDNARLKPHVVGLKFETNDDLVALMLLKGQLDDMCFRDISLEMPFFPYSTMDHTDGSRPLSLKYVADFINGLNFSHVVAWEPHSTVLPALLSRCIMRDTTLELLDTALQRAGRPVICFPDLGAVKRYEALRTIYPALTFEKNRRFTDGVITDMRCVDDLPPDIDEYTAIIVDDLCRKGRTFTSCADILKAAGVKTVILCVAHIEPAAYKGVLLPDSSVDMVYATDSCLPAERPDCSKLNLIRCFEGGENHV